MKKRTTRILGLLLPALLVLGMVPASAQEEPEPDATLFFGLTADNEIVTFSDDAAGPEEFSDAVTIDGLDAGDTLVGLDSRTATGQLFGVTDTSRIVSITADVGDDDDVTYEASYPGETFIDEFPLVEPQAFDFNPTVDRIRLFAGGQGNARANPNTGGFVQVDGSLNYVNAGFDEPIGVATAYTNSSGTPETTTQFAIDGANGVALAQLEAPNDGTLQDPTQITADRDPLSLASPEVGFDIVSDGEGEDLANNSAFVAVQLDGNETSTVHTLDLESAEVDAGVDSGVVLTAITAAILDAPGDEGEVLWGVTGGNRLVQFGSDSSTRITFSTEVTGLLPEEDVRSIDVRPANDDLFALTTLNRVGTIDPSDGAFEPVGDDVSLDPILVGELVSIDFNPTVDLIRVVSSDGENLRVSPETGEVVEDGVDGTLTYAEDDENADVDPSVVGAAYTNSVPDAEETTLYDLEAAAGTLVIQDPPNDGVLNTVGDLVVTGAEDAELDTPIGFDISGLTDTPFISAGVDDGDPDTFAPALHTIDLETAVITPVEGVDEETGLTPIGAPVVTITAAPEVDDDSIIRISGPGRLGTAIAVSEFGFDPETTDTVYVASADDYPDAVTGGPAAFLDDAPVLLTGRAFLPPETADEIERLDPANIVILGGPNAITDETVADIAAVNDADTGRVFGETRFETAAAVSADAFTDAEAVETVYVATGLFFSDALTGGALASLDPEGPVLLTHDEVPTAAVAELERLSPDNIVVFGGTEAVPDSVVEDLGEFTDGEVTRLSEPGGNRFDTAAEILNAFGDAETERVYVATGEDFPDALATVPVAAQDQTGIALSGRDSLTDSTRDAIAARTPSQIVIVGGFEVISQEVEDELRAIVEGEEPPPGDPNPEG